jgi:hypothetical protein
MILPGRGAEPSLHAARAGDIKENVMQKRTVSLPKAAVGAIIAASLSLSMVTLASADQAGGPTAAAPATVKKHKPTYYSHHPYYSHYSHYPQNQADYRRLYGAEYQHMFPPGMSTWPEGSPHYHGGLHPGVTFDDEQ